MSVVLTPIQQNDLRTVAGMIVPASDEYKVPGADDAAVQADILATLGRDAGMVQQALDHLAGLAGKPLADLDATQRDKVGQEFRATGGAAAATLRSRSDVRHFRSRPDLRPPRLEVLRAPAAASDRYLFLSPSSGPGGLTLARGTSSSRGCSPCCCCRWRRASARRGWGRRTSCSWRGCWPSAY